MVGADLAYDKSSSTYQSLLDVWFPLGSASEKGTDKIDKLRIAYGRDVAILPLDQLRNIIASGGFETPVLFLQTGLIHAWYAKRITDL